MDLKLNDWKVILVRMTYGINCSENLPKSVCKFFWMFLLSLIILPFGGWFGYIINFNNIKKYKKSITKVWFDFNIPLIILPILNILAGCLGLIFCHEFIPILFFTKILPIYKILLLFNFYSFIGLILTLIMYGISYLLFRIINYFYLEVQFYSIRKNLTKVKSSNNIFKQYFKSIKNKFCPMINYQNNE